MRTDCGFPCDVASWLYAIDWHMFWTIVGAIVLAKVIVAVIEAVAATL